MAAMMHTWITAQIQKRREDVFICYVNYRKNGIYESKIS
jgi:hypothetical protein